MTKLYSEDSITGLKKQRNKYLILTLLFFLLANISAILIFVFTNRKNLLVMEIVLIVLLFVLLSISAFIGLTFFRKVIYRIKLIQSFSSVVNKRNEVTGEVEYLNEKRKYYGFTFTKVKINDSYYFVEEGVVLPKNTTVIIKKGFVVAYE